MQESTELNNQLLSDIPGMEAEDGGEYRARRKEVYERIVREAATRTEQKLAEAENVRMDNAPLVKFPSRPAERVKGIRI